MRKTATVVYTLVLVLGAVRQLAGQQPGRSEAIPDQYIVQLRPGLDSEATARNLAAQHGLGLGRIYRYALNGFSAFVPAARLAQLQADSRVLLVEPDLTVYAFAQTIPTGIRRIAADGSATAKIDGIDERVDVDIAILDTGVDLDHPDLNVHRSTDCANGVFNVTCNDGAGDDGHGHGSHVAGTVGALDNDIGVVGVAPGARIWSVRVLNNNGSGRLSWIIAGIDWVTAHAGDIEVANMSLGGQGLSSALRTAIQNSVAVGVVYVVAAGNSAADVYGSDLDFGTSDDYFPASYPEVAAISALADSDGQAGGTGSSTSYGPDDTLASFSNFSNNAVIGNPVNSPGAAIDLAAPGVSILSTYKGGGYATFSGTSMASPHVAGAVGLYVATNARANSASDVYDIRQDLINLWYQPQSAWGPLNTNDPDSNKEDLIYVPGDGTPPNTAPTASIFAPADGLTVNGDVTVQISASDNEDADDALTVEWNLDGGSWQVANYNAGTGYYEAPWDTTAATDGGHTINARVTDSGGATSATASSSVTVNNGGGGGGGGDDPATTHIGDLDASSVNNGSTWTAQVTITVHNGAGATVHGSWSNGASGLASCAVNGSGQCMVSAGGIPKRTGTVTFSITDIIGGSTDYDASDNHDPDGDSNGTSITVSKP
jgi:subtilisin family serine protease